MCGLFRWPTQRQCCRRVGAASTNATTGSGREGQANVNDAVAEGVTALMPKHGHPSERVTPSKSSWCVFVVFGVFKGHIERVRLFLKQAGARVDAANLLWPRKIRQFRLFLWTCSSACPGTSIVQTYSRRATGASVSPTAQKE